MNSMSYVRKIALFIIIIQSINIKSEIDKKIDPTVKYQIEAQERMLDKQLEAQKEKLVSDSTKKTFLVIATAFVAGGVGTWRKFTWISDKMFKTKDAISKKTKYYYKRLIHGKKAKLDPEKYNELLKKIHQTNKLVDQTNRRLFEILITSIEIEPELASIYRQRYIDQPLPECIDGINIDNYVTYEPGFIEAFKKDIKQLYSKIKGIPFTK